MMNDQQGKLDTIPIYRSYYEAICDLEDEDQLAMLKAICEYGFYGTEPDLKGISSTLMKVMKPILQNNRERSLSGRKGGRPKKDGGDAFEGF